MEYFSSTEDAPEAEILPQQKKKDINASILICVISFYIERALIGIKPDRFIRVNHASPYNTYIREKEKCGENKLKLFLTLRRMGIELRIVYKVPVKSKGSVTVEESIEIVSGNSVISDSIQNVKECIHISIDSYGRVLNHTVYAPKRISEALELEIPRNTDEKCKFFRYDQKHINTLPTTRKEALTHPCYTIEPDTKRYLLYPKGIGSVGQIKDRTKRHKLKSKVQKEQALRVYPISHIHKLLTYAEILRENKKLVPDAIPFRVLSPNKFYPEGIKVYAPWQIENTIKNPDVIAIPAQIPHGMVYLTETLFIKYNVEIGSIPVIGSVYNHVTQRKEPVASGLLLTERELAENRESILISVHKSIINGILIKNRKLIVNIQVLSVQALRYLDILEQLN